jgi:hypothetical protein
MQGSVRGHVLTEQGAPVPGASVVIAQGPGPAPDIAAESDEAGEFVFDGLPAGSYVLQAFGPAGETGETSVDVPAGGSAEARIVLRS